jgi:hypothetical protein
MPKGTIMIAEVLIVLNTFTSKNETLFVVTKENLFPTKQILPNNDPLELAKELFAEVTGLIPSWINPVLDNVTVNSEKISVVYTIFLQGETKLSNNYSWQIFDKVKQQESKVLEKIGFNR